MHIFARSQGYRDSGQLNPRLKCIELCIEVPSLMDLHGSPWVFMGLLYPSTVWRPVGSNGPCSCPRTALALAIPSCLDLDSTACLGVEHGPRMPHGYSFLILLLSDCFNMVLHPLRQWTPK